MLRCNNLLISRISVCAPSTSLGHLHGSLASQSLPNVKPVQDELPHLDPPAPSPFSTARVTSGSRTAKQHLSIVGDDDHLEMWTKMEPRGLVSAYLQLSKSKLTLLITSTAVAGYLMGPNAIDMVALCGCAAGTALLSSAANACNQLLEAPYDAQMKRTQSRVLVVHRFSPLHAFSFAGVSAVAGTALLLTTSNELAASLGVLNLLLYAGVYTPMKRTSIACTWAGAVVGAIPPLMGYAAATGALDAGALCLAAILYSWQFPHFNGLSWNLRGDYSKAGYRVMCVTDQALCRRTSLRHSLALLFLCSVAAPLSDLTTIAFALDSIPVNAVMLYLSYKFYRAPDAKNSRQLFFYSLLYLPLMMGLMVVSNGGRNSEQKKKEDFI